MNEWCLWNIHGCTEYFWRKLKEGKTIKPFLSAYSYSVLILLFLLLSISYPAKANTATDAGNDFPGTVFLSGSGTGNVEDRVSFDLLASGDSSAISLSEVKFLITDIRTDDPKLYFIDSSSFQYHWRFFNEALGWNLSLLDFNTRTYSDLNRRLIAGSVVAHDRYAAEGRSSGVYVIEFWPSDPVHAQQVSMAFRLVTDGMKFAEGSVFYHPTGETQVRIYNEEIQLFDSAGVPVLFTSDLFSDVDYAALNIGEACGILREGGSTGAYSVVDIVVFETIPNDISHVAGIITTIPQTPLSHINLKAIQNGTPNAYIPGFTESGEFQSLLGKYVHYSAFPGGYTIEEISYHHAIMWLASARPDTVTVLQRELTEKRILSVEEIRLEQSSAYGAKAASIGELTWCLPSFSVPDGFAVPFFFYHEFMEHNDLYHAADSLAMLNTINLGAEEWKEQLREFRERIRESEVPAWMVDSLSAMAAQFEPGVSLRCRSSTNNEDFSGWSGAGLYNSFTHHADEGHISETIKQVWAGIWTYRAFEEREFYRIDHLSTAMAVLVHPSYRNEQANGVAVTRNIFNPFITGFYVNVQVGDDMVTNPESQSIPEEFLLSFQNLTGTVANEIQYIRLSNRLPAHSHVLTDEQIQQLSDYLERIHSHFAEVYGVDRTDIHFAMEIEFKITSQGELVVKQARPWVSPQ